MNWYITSWVVLGLWFASMAAIRWMDRRRDKARDMVVQALASRFRDLATINQNLAVGLAAHAKIQKDSEDESAMLKAMAAIAAMNGAHASAEAFNQAANITESLLLHGQALEHLDPSSHSNEMMAKVIEATQAKLQN
jgi:hypothetical protein